jgi:hypothetical protein
VHRSLPRLGEPASNCSPQVQVFGDGDGLVVALGDRECSVQRRHQKVIEESPSTFVDDSLRSALLSAAVSLCSAAQYRSAGTVEFLVDIDTHKFYFLEVNTRLQVEHGITELVTGTDIVDMMLRLQLEVRLHCMLPGPFYLHRCSSFIALRCCAYCMVPLHDAIQCAPPRQVEPSLESAPLIFPLHHRMPLSLPGNFVPLKQPWNLP